ncbi:hypothetical protein [Streptomyces beigongshangae]|uniref:hypothetical protein n=1 Tax=Streptomyces beigongshangae TaxID=2841597 RepID=UPI001C846F15|nr:hypothetical protein [Streptomyces sp. REN17]
MNGESGRCREYVIDVRDGRVGQVMGREGGYVQLRPVEGGLEWDCPPEAVGEATVAEVLLARVRRINQEGRLP